MRISIPLDLSSRYFVPLSRFIRSRRPTPILSPKASWVDIDRVSSMTTIQTKAAIAEATSGLALFIIVDNNIKAAGAERLPGVLDSAEPQLTSISASSPQ